MARHPRWSCSLRNSNRELLWAKHQVTTRFQHRCSHIFAPKSIAKVEVSRCINPLSNSRKRSYSDAKQPFGPEQRFWADQTALWQRPSSHRVHFRSLLVETFHIRKNFEKLKQVEQLLPANASTLWCFHSAISCKRKDHGSPNNDLSHKRVDSCLWWTKLDQLAHAVLKLDSQLPPHGHFGWFKAWAYIKWRTRGLLESLCKLSVASDLSDTQGAV